MSNALSQNPGTPPAPNMGLHPTANSGNAMAASGGPQAPAGVSPNAMQGAQPQVPAPTHQQTVVALRHFSAIEKELTTLLSDPDVGKADLKSKVQDGTIGLVSSGILTPATSITMLTTFPEKPYDQKVWLQQHLQQTMQAATLILTHHQAGYLGQAVDTTPPDPDNHQADVAGLMGNYNGAQANAR
jgi:hypothetical protein